MAKRKDEREEEQDQGTKAEHGIGREDAAMENRGTKADLGSDDDPSWLKDPKADIVDPVHAEGDDFDDHDEDADWDDGPEMEAEAEVDVDIDDDEEEEMER